MGIEGFHRYLREYGLLSKCIQEANARTRRSVDHVFVDINNFLHPAARKVSCERDLLLLVQDKLKRIFQVYRPRKSVFLALDGPGPLAKVLTQRSRRMAKARLEQKKLLEEPEESSSSSTKQLAFDPLNFTPGSSFMQFAKEKLIKFAHNRSTVLKDVEFIISGADCIGEGEWKIFEHINHSDRVARGDICLIAGSDSDLLLFGLSSLNRCPENSIYVMANLNLKTQASYSSFSEYNISMLRQSILSMFPGIEDANSVIDDFMLLALFNGNDYIPRLKQFRQQQVWNKYVQFRKENRGIAGQLYDSTSSSFNIQNLATVLSVCPVALEPHPSENRREAKLLNSLKEAVERSSSDQPKGWLTSLEQQFFSQYQMTNATPLFSIEKITKISPCDSDDKKKKTKAKKSEFQAVLTTSASSSSDTPIIRIESSWHGKQKAAESEVLQSFIDSHFESDLVPHFLNRIAALDSTQNKWRLVPHDKIRQVLLESFAERQKKNNNSSVPEAPSAPSHPSALAPLIEWTPHDQIADGLVADERALPRLQRIAIYLEGAAWTLSYLKAELSHRNFGYYYPLSTGPPAYLFSKAAEELRQRCAASQRQQLQSVDLVSTSSLSFKQKFMQIQQLGAWKTPLLPLIFLTCLTPFQGRHILPFAYQSLFDSTTSPIADLLNPSLPLPVEEDEIDEAGAEEDGDLEQETPTAVIQRTWGNVSRAVERVSSAVCEIRDQEMAEGRYPLSHHFEFSGHAIVRAPAPSSSSSSREEAASSIKKVSG